MEIQRNETESFGLDPKLEVTPHTTSVLVEGGAARATRSSTFVHTRSLLFLAVLTTGIFGLTAWYANAAFSAELANNATNALHTIFSIEVGSAIAILRILQGVLATLTTVSLNYTFEAIEWALVSDGNGINCLQLLGISPATGVMGTLGLIIDTHSRVIDRGWAALRIITIIATWLAGILLFLKTSLMTEYDPTYTYEVTAGVGAFNGSYISSFLGDLQNSQPGYGYTIVPFNLMAMSYNLVGNSMQATISGAIDKSCGSIDSPCDSYLFTGGLSMTTPWPPTGYSSYPLINIYNLPATQIEFKRGINNSHIFSNSECAVYGSDGTIVGVRLCISEDSQISGSYLAGIYVCLNGTNGDECINSGPAPNLTTTFSVFSRKASIVTSRLNYTIMSVLDVGEPALNNNIDIPSYRLVMDWLLDFNASGIPAPSSIAGVFWSSPDQLSSSYWSSELYNVLQSILVFPIWHFNPNNFGNTQLNAKEMVSGLPPEFYTTASVTRPYTRIVINRYMFIAFLVLESAMLAFVWLVPIWLWISPRRLPKTSSYPLIDFAFKSSILSGSSLDDVSRRLFRANNREARSILKDVSVSLYKVK